jgi:ribosome-binding factor A
MHMETKRQRQTAEVVRRHFSELLMQEGSALSGGALVTVTMVKMSSDLGLAKIYLSVYGTENKQAVLMMFQQEAMRLRQSLAQRVRNKMRRVPDIDFYLDDTLDEMYRLNEIFDKLHDDNQMGSEEE